MSPRRAAAAGIFMGVLFTGVLGWTAACRQAPERQAAEAVRAAPAEEPPPLFTGGANQMDVTLFFLRADGEVLAPETRRIFRTATVNDRARQTLQALLGGSESGLLPSVPAGTTLRELYLTRDGTAYVDLGPEFLRGIETGSSDAVNAVYAVVNTLAYNFSEILKVKILIDGDEAEDVGGHLDLSRPILPEMSLVSAEPAGPPSAPGGAPGFGVPAMPSSHDADANAGAGTDGMVP